MTRSKTLKSIFIPLAISAVVYMVLSLAMPLLIGRASYRMHAPILGLVLMACSNLSIPLALGFFNYKYLERAQAAMWWLVLIPLFGEILKLFTFLPFVLPMRVEFFPSVFNFVLGAGLVLAGGYISKRISWNATKSG